MSAAPDTKPFETVIDFGRVREGVDRRMERDGAPATLVARLDSGTDDAPPRKIDIHRGHNGGPVLFYGTAIVQMNV